MEPSLRIASPLPAAWVVAFATALATLGATSSGCKCNPDPGDSAEEAGAPPPATAALADGEHAIAFAAIDDASGWLAWAVRVGRAISEVTGETPPWPAVIDELSTPQGWQQRGIDPAAGLALVFDDRLMTPATPFPLPILWFRPTDEAALAKAAQEAGVALAWQEEQGGVRAGTLGRMHIWQAQRDGWAAWLLSPDGPPDAALRAPFLAATAPPPTSLANNPHLARTVGRLQTGPKLVMLARLTPTIGSAIRSSTPSAGTLVDWLELFPTTVIGFGPSSGAILWGARPDVGQALATAFATEAPPAEWASHMGDTDVAIRISVALPALVDSLLAVIPPEPPALREALAGFAQTFEAEVGLPWATAARALSGNALIVVETPPGGAPSSRPPAVFAGIGDAEAFSALAARIEATVGQDANALRRSEVDGTTRWEIGPPGSGYTVVRRGNSLIGAAPAQLEARLAAPPKGASPPPAALLEPGHALVLWVGAGVLAAATETMPQGQAIRRAAEAAFATSGQGGSLPMTLVVDVDDAGIHLSGQQGLLLVGGMAAIAIPAFLKYMKRSKEAEARTYLRSLQASATIALDIEKVGPDGTVQPPGFPESAPLTPAEDPCADGEPGYLSSPDAWSHPSWMALAFKPEGKLNYRYALERSADGKTLVARAVGDLDCDGEPSVLEMSIHIGDDGRAVRDSEVKVVDPLE